MRAYIRARWLAVTFFRSIQGFYPANVPWPPLPCMLKAQSNSEARGRARTYILRNIFGAFVRAPPECFFLSVPSESSWIAEDGDGHKNIFSMQS